MQNTHTHTHTHTQGKLYHVKKLTTCCNDNILDIWVKYVINITFIPFYFLKYDY